MKQKRSLESLSKVLFLGDSYTCGEGVETHETWPAILKERFFNEFGVALKSKVIAKTSWRVDQLLNAIQGRNLKPEWDLITICIGVNNQYQKGSLDTFEKDLIELCEYTKALLVNANSRILLLSIPDWGHSPFAKDRDNQSISHSIDAFNRVIEKTAQTMCFSFIDWTPLSRQLSQDAQAYCDDGLHPSAWQYREWVNLLFDNDFCKFR